MSFKIYPREKVQSNTWSNQTQQPLGAFRLVRILKNLMPLYSLFFSPLHLCHSSLAPFSPCNWISSGWVLTCIWSSKRVLLGGFVCFFSEKLQGSFHNNFSRNTGCCNDIILSEHEKFKARVTDPGFSCCHVTSEGAVTFLLHNKTTMLNQD